jgi:hypothetical protein
MGSLNDKSAEKAVEAAGVDVAHASVITTKSYQPEVVLNDVDDSKTPRVFGRLWRELVSVFTLAFAPGLNV